MKKLIVLAASRLFHGRSPMKITRRFALATLLVLQVAVVLGAPAPASAGAHKTTQVKLYPTADSPGRNATDTVTGYKWSRSDAAYYPVGVSLSRLAPNAAYYMPVTVYNTRWGTEEVVNVLIQIDARGNGEGGFGRSDYYYFIIPTGQVYDASGTLVLTSNR